MISSGGQQKTVDRIPATVANGFAFHSATFRPLIRTIIVKRIRFSGLLIASLLVALVAQAAPLPASRPSGPLATQPAQLRSAQTRPANAQSPQTKPAGGVSERDARRAEQLSKRAIAMLEQHRLDEAETILKQAVALDPENSVNLYNLACCKSLKHQPDVAMDYLEKSAEAGYTDFVHVSLDHDLDALRDLPRYKLFITNKQRFQRKAAEHALRELRDRFGETYLYEIDENDKLIFATNVDQPTLDALKKNLQAQAKSQWAQLFEHKPDEFISVVVPSAEDYKKLVKMPGVGGIYIDGAKILIAEHLGQVMTHEFTHALHAADRAPLGQDHPVWLAEGLASMYEAATWQGGMLVPHDNFRLRFLQNAARGKRLLPLDKLLKMQQKQFIDRANLAYGQSSSLLLYLFEHDLLRRFYDAYKADYSSDMTGKIALEQATGRSLEDLEKDWTDWMLHRSAPPRSTGPDGAFLGAALGDANDGVKLESVLPNGPAEKAGLQANDVLVGIDGQEIRDNLSFTPALLDHKPGDRVMVRIRRSGKYLDIPLILARRSEFVRPATRPTSRPGR
jgi:hypothetical protein